MEQYDVIIVGGSYSGLSAAMTLGRSLRKVLIIDAGKPCNQQTPLSHNFLTQDGVPPAEIASISKEQVLAYTSVQFLEETVTEAIKTNGGFAVKTTGGESFLASKLILATGITDEMPNIPGFSACWGISVIHCPYCHGYEFKGQQTALLADPSKAMHLVPLLNNLTDHLTVLTNGSSHWKTEDLDRLERKGIAIVTQTLTEVVHVDGRLRELIFEGQFKLPMDAMYASVPFHFPVNLPEQLGCELADSGHIQVDSFQKTSVEDVFACGDGASGMRSVSSAVASGNISGAVVNMELAVVDF